MVLIDDLVDLLSDLRWPDPPAPAGLPLQCFLQRSQYSWTWHDGTNPVTIENAHVIIGEAKGSWRHHFPFISAIRSLWKSASMACLFMPSKLWRYVFFIIYIYNTSFSFLTRFHSSFPLSYCTQTLLHSISIYFVYWLYILFQFKDDLLKCILTYSVFFILWSIDSLYILLICRFVFISLFIIFLTHVQYPLTNNSKCSDQ